MGYIHPGHGFQLAVPEYHPRIQHRLYHGQQRGRRGGECCNAHVRVLTRQAEEEKIPDVPESGVTQGVLPRIIATLVNRRRQVKGLMKDKSATPAQLQQVSHLVYRIQADNQYDIRQQALKLTANSMYGCLGFAGSRFSSRPLAALTTFKGREILTHTRELAESLQLDVSIFNDQGPGLF